MFRLVVQCITLVLYAAATAELLPETWDQQEAAMLEYMDIRTLQRRRWFSVGKSKGKRGIAPTVRESYEKERCRERPVTLSCFKEPNPTVLDEADDPSGGSDIPLWLAIFLVLVGTLVFLDYNDYDPTRQPRAASERWDSAQRCSTPVVCQRRRQVSLLSLASRSYRLALPVKLMNAILKCWIKQWLVLRHTVLSHAKGVVKISFTYSLLSQFITDQRQWLNF